MQRLDGEFVLTSKGTWYRVPSSKVVSTCIVEWDHE
jgi:hypothetical protein